MIQNFQVKLIVNHVHTVKVVVPATSRQEAVAQLTTLYRGNFVVVL